MNGSKIRVKFHYPGRDMALDAVKGRLLKGLLSDAGISADLPCGGAGRCGRCKVRFLEGAPVPCSLDKAFLTKEEIDLGVRLLCRCVLSGDCTVDMEYGAVLRENIKAETAESEGESPDNYDSCAIAIDIGTTTIAAALMGLKKDAGEAFGDVLRTGSCVNHQRSYGSDVISRISACSDTADAKKMRELVIGDIAELITTVTASFDKTRVKPELIAIAGNTTMLHILRGKDATGLGVYPYRTCGLEAEVLNTAEIFDGAAECISDNCNVIIFPGISAFVGADIVAGLYYLKKTEGALGQETFLFADLGTNGEMALWDGRELRVTSTAAGPVFEGGGISCGMPSTAGAIEHLSIDGNNMKCSYSSIEGASPIGLCGSGVMEAAAELFRTGLIDETGLLTEEFFDKGYPIVPERGIYFTGKDIRNVQLAKAAINSGMRAILEDCNPDRVYVAGGFGSHIDPKKLGGLNMFPGEFINRTKALGNTSLKGCIQLIKQSFFDGEYDKALAEASAIAGMAREIVLADSESFGDEYIEAINFKK